MPLPHEPRAGRLLPSSAASDPNAPFAAAVCETTIAPALWNAARLILRQAVVDDFIARYPEQARAWRARGPDGFEDRLRDMAGRPLGDGCEGAALERDLIRGIVADMPPSVAGAMAPRALN